MNWIPFSLHFQGTKELSEETGLDLLEASKLQS